MFGRVYRCTSCDFDFSSGWSHHAGGQLLVCCDCGTHFVLGGGRSCWGARTGEDLQLFQRDGERDIPIGMRVVIRVRAVPGGESWDGISYLDLPDLACPHCDRPGALVQSLQEHQPCPACHRGTVVVAGSCIY
jgi:hypothetical protein